MQSNATELSKETMLYPRAIGVGTANPETSYDQETIADLFGEKSPRIRKLFKNSHIQKRYLYLPKPDVNGLLRQEDASSLQAKHLHGSLEMGCEAINKSLVESNLTVNDIDYIICVSSTGFICPGLSAHITKKMNFRSDIRRADILGMGCSAGMNGLQSASEYAKANPGKKVMLLMAEVCSAAYFIDGTVTTAVVNSLFGDGAAALIVTASNDNSWFDGPLIMDFESEVITNNIDALRYDFVEGMFSFYLDRDIPYVIGSNIHKPIQRLLTRNNLKLRDIDHWIIHSGGKKVIDSIKYNINVTNYDVRHTLNVLRDYGNMSSCSFMFSYDLLRKENIVNEGDLGLAIAMGPGVAIETALLRW
ncbi:Naringenin-chalcone synthase [hydrothermal vent metagenome]|uniref:Naringenin-chalcone synthase n=1 Tax=hydrothermal vent metagenome TaxID=652676 RepID=A0A3B1BJ35_9ZZZZ